MFSAFAFRIPIHSQHFQNHQQDEPTSPTETPLRQTRQYTEAPSTSPFPSYFPTEHARFKGFEGDYAFQISGSVVKKKIFHIPFAAIGGVELEEGGECKMFAKV